MTSSTWVGRCDEYDAAGRLLRQFKYMEIDYTNGATITAERYYKADGAPDYRYEYRYANNGELAEKKMILGETQNHGRWEYRQEHGRIAAAMWFNRNGEMETRDAYVYADDGRSAVRTRENIGEWRHRYDRHGREIEVTGAPYSGAAMETLDYEYDQDGHIVRIRQQSFTRRVVSFTPR